MIIAPNTSVAISEQLDNRQLVYLALTGSRLYGTHNKDSDYDYRGIYANSSRELTGQFGPKSIVVNTEDITLHSLSEFTRLVHGGNPNILEMLFIPDTHLIEIHPSYWHLRMQYQKMALTRQACRKYIAYAMGQLRKNKNHAQKDTLRTKYKAGNDSGGFYDTKYAMHIVRLLENCKEILTEKTLTPSFLEHPMLEQLIRIREGEEFKTEVALRKYTYAKVDELELLLEASDLPEFCSDDIWKVLEKTYLSILNLMKY